MWICRGRVSRLARGSGLTGVSPGEESLRCLLEDGVHPVGADSVLQPRDEFAAEDR
jgi:hypothetical protein